LLNASWAVNPLRRRTTMMLYSTPSSLRCTVSENTARKCCYILLPWNMRLCHSVW
jgi:hypothetical protein